MVLDRWDGVSGVPGLGVSVPGSRATTISTQPLKQWEEKGKKGTKSKLQVGSKSTAKTNIAKINVRLPRILSIRSSSFSSGQTNTSKTPTNTNNNGKNENGFSIPPPLPSGFSMPPPLPRVQTTSSAARNSGRRQWKPLITNNQQKMTGDCHQQKMTQDYHQQKMTGGDFAVNSSSNSSKASYKKEQYKSNSQPPLSKSKSFRSLGSRFGKSVLAENSFVPSDCNYYPCSRCNCCCEKHKKTKRVMFREVTGQPVSFPTKGSSFSNQVSSFPNQASSLSNQASSFPTKSSSFPNKKRIVGVNQHHKENHFGGPFEYSDFSSTKPPGYSDKMYENVSDYVDKPFSEGVVPTRWSLSGCDSRALMTQTVGHASSNYPYFTSRVDIVDSDHYQSPKEIDGDYSYAYSDCISPAFIIRSEGDPAFNENIYEEINVEDKTEDEENTDKTNEFSRSPQFSLKSLSSSQKSVSLERKEGENSNSVKGEGYKRIISEELNGGSDGYGRLISEELNGGPECTPMFEDLEEVNRKMSHLHMDVKDLLQPLTYSSNSNHSRGTADSGFESGELSSINSSSFSTSKSSVVSRTNSSEAGESIFSENVLNKSFKGLHKLSSLFAKFGDKDMSSPNKIPPSLPSRNSTLWQSQSVHHFEDFNL